MNPKHLFSLLTDSAWSLEPLSVQFSSEEYEYLIRFCEVNRNGLVDRIRKQDVGQPLAILIYRITYLLLDKWSKDGDYRFLNLLYKFKAKCYLDYLPKDAKSIALRNLLEKTLRREQQRG